MARWWFVLVAVAACEKAPPSNEKELDDSNELPPVPKHRQLAYQPGNIARYTLAMEIESAPGSDAVMNATGTAAIAFTAGANPRERDARLEKLVMAMDGSGQKIKVEVTHDELVLDFAGSQQRAKRGQTGGLVDVAALVDHPVTTLTFAADNTVVSRGNPKNPFAQMGADLFGTTLIMFPDLPRAPIAPGHTWSFKRNISMDGGLGTIDVVYRFEHAGLAACPSGPPTCAVLAFTTAPQLANQGSAATPSYAFSGRVYFDLDRGRVDESRVKMEMTVKQVVSTGTFTLKPR